MPLLLVLAVLSGTVRLSAAALLPENFIYFSEIRADLRRDQLYRLHLGPEILQQCAADCRDIRLFDGRGVEVPYVIAEHRIEGKKTESYVQVFPHQDVL